MPDFSLKARVQWAPRSSAGQFVSARVGPAALKATEAITRQIYDRSQQLVPVDTGALKASGHMAVTETGQTVVGHVAYDSAHASYVEYGTGIRGASSPMAGPFPYSPNWPGMAPSPYLRPATDEARADVMAHYRSNLTAALK